MLNTEHGSEEVRGMLETKHGNEEIDGGCVPASVADRHERWGLPALLVFALAVRFAATRFVPTEIESDALAYWTMAENLVAGRGLVDHYGNYAYFSPGYPLLLAAAFATFGVSVAVALAVNVLLGGLSVYLLYRAARSFSGSAVAGLVAAALWAVYPPSIVYATYLAKENLQIPLVVALAWIAAAYPCCGGGATRHRTALALATGLLTGASALAGITGCAVAFVTAIVIARSAGPRSGGSGRQRAAHLALLALGAALVVGPWLARNAVQLGAPAFSTNGGFNLYLGNNPKAKGIFRRIERTPEAKEWRAVREQSGELAGDRALGRAALEFIRDEPGRALELALWRVVRFWEPPLAREEGEDSALQHLMRRAWLVQYVGLVALALAGLGLWRRYWPLWLALVLYTAAHAPFFVLSRLRLPIMPLVCALAAFSALAWWQRWRRRSAPVA